MITTIELLKANPTTKIGIYIHIPFCKTKCEYCDFVSIPIKENIPDSYIKAIIKEIGNEPFDNEIISIYVGGGTPSLLTIEQLNTIISHINKIFKLNNTEITIEINPDDINETWVRDIKLIGINRVSIGVQSFKDNELKYLGRRHDAKKAIQACELIANYFDNWNIDLIFGIPGQNEISWKENLNTAIKLNPSHVSTYNLTFEEGTMLYALKLKDKPDDDFCLDLYEYTQIYLKSNDYEHYEISNFAKKDYQCKHNLIYWHNEYYLGVGTSAFSFLGNIRCSNINDIYKYIEFPGKKNEVDKLTEEEIKLETLIQHFRLSEGISEDTYYKRFSSFIEKDFGLTLKKLIKRGLLEYNQKTYRPTEQGFYLNNEIGRELLNYNK